jgi:hypothetical protein
MLPGVNYACCGHGLRDAKEPYVSFSEEGQRGAGIRRLLQQARQAGTLHKGVSHTLYGDDALRYFHTRGVGPEEFAFSMADALDKLEEGLNRSH